MPTRWPRTSRDQSMLPRRFGIVLHVSTELSDYSRKLFHSTVARCRALEQCHRTPECISAMPVLPPGWCRSCSRQVLVLFMIYWTCPPSSTFISLNSATVCVRRPFRASWEDIDVGNPGYRMISTKSSASKTTCFQAVLSGQWLLDERVLVSTSSSSIVRGAIPRISASRSGATR